MSDVILTLALLAGMASVTMHVLGSYGILGSKGLYHVVYHWDTANHALAAFAISAVALVFWSAWLDGWVLDVAVVATVVSIGFAWEVYEYVWWDEHEKRTWRQYVEDTALDVVVEYAVAITVLLVRGYVPLVA